MNSAFRLVLRLLLFLAPLAASAQTLNIADHVQTVATLTNTVVTMTGKSELHITGTGDPISGCTINLNSADAWFFMDNLQPSTVAATFLGRVRVSGAAAVLDTNVRVVQFAVGTVVIPQPPDFAALEVFDGRYFAGPSKLLRPYIAYDDLHLGTMKMAISSFRLKHGYMATLAQNENGTGVSKCYVAQDGDLDVGLLPAALDNSVRFVRVFPWRWVAKKGIAGNIEPNLNVKWLYNWNLSRTSPLDWEYVPIRQTRYWPGLNEDWKYRGATHVLGFNEPDHTDQANMTVPEAIANWPILLATGLRVGAPAVSDGGLSWLYSFISQADAANLRVDFVPVHYYRSYSNPANPAGAANQLYNYLKGIYDTVKRPLWVTEWNNGANWTTDPDPTFAQQTATVAAMIDMLDNAPFVERYAIYNWVEDVRRVVWDDNSTTDAGAVYRDNASPLAVVQEMADAGSGNSASYDFDGNAHDSWGNGQDGMLVGAPVYVPGKYGQALSLDGVSDYVQLSPRIADTTDFTFAAWVWWNGGGNWQRIFDFGSGTSNYLALTPKAGTAGMRFLMRDGGAEQQLNTGALVTGTWVHVAITIAGNTGKLFVNGALVNTNTTMTINPVDVDTKFNYLGKSQSADPLFNGKLDDVRIVSSALTDAQIAAIAATGPPQFSNTTLVKTGAVAMQPFTNSLAGDASGGAGARTFSKMSGPAWLAVAQNGALTGVPTSRDAGTNVFSVRVTDTNGAIHGATLQIPVAASGNLVARYAFDGNTNAVVGTAPGVLTGAPVYVAGKYGQALQFDGATNFVTLPAGVATSSEITVATWVNWSGGSNWQRIFDFGNGTGEYMILSPKTASNTLRFEIKNNGTSQLIEASPLPIGQWVHVAVTLGANTARLYVNGGLVASGTVTIRPTDFDPATNFLGDSQFAADPLFNGRLDDFQIFNQALTASQVAALVNARAPVFTADPIVKTSASAGVAYEQTLAGSATDADGGTLTFSKVSGPRWLSIDASGRISGVPAASDAGTNRFVVRVTDPTLLADEAVLNISVAANSSGLVAQYQFDGTTTNTFGSGAGVTTGSPAYVAGLFDQALNFDGVDDLVTLPANVTGPLTDVTFAARVRWAGGGSWQRIFDFGNGIGEYMILTPSSGTGTLQFAIQNSSGTVQRLSGPSPLPVGEWTHVAVTLIGNTGTLYVNGAAVATTSITIHPVNIAQTANYLGDSQFAADPLFAGALDDFRIYNRGLSATEVAALASPMAATSVPDSSFTGWISTIAFPSGQSGALADPDADGVNNAWEYLFGTDPLLSASGAFPAAQLRSAASLGLSGSKTYLTLQARVKKQRLGASISALAASSIEALTNADAALHALQAGAPVPDGAYEIITFYYDVAIEDSPTGRGAMRLRAVLP